MKRRTVALLLNAFLLPGLGQLYLGRKAVGVAILLVANLFLLLGLFLLLKGAAPLIASQMTTGKIDPAEVLAAIDSVAGYGRALLLAFLLLWGYALVDLLKNGPTN
jgi:TM2 domain-containing membrane protein YozV